MTPRVCTRSPHARADHGCGDGLHVRIHVVTIHVVTFTNRHASWPRVIKRSPGWDPAGCRVGLTQGKQVVAGPRPKRRG